jgi:hypothetical protein
MKKKIGIIKKVLIIDESGKREKIHLHGVPSTKTTDVEALRDNIYAYTKAKYVHLEYMEVN